MALWRAGVDTGGTFTDVVLIGPGRSRHMTNSLNTPIEALELLADATVTLLSDRRGSRPYGLAGGGPGAAGRPLFQRGPHPREPVAPRGASPEVEPVEELPALCVVRARAGDRLRNETPGGGGWGPA
jgi:N-methylhydantoinase B